MGFKEWAQQGKVKIDKPDIGAPANAPSLCRLTLPVEPHYCMKAYMSTRADIQCVDNQFLNSEGETIYYGVSMYDNEVLTTLTSIGTKQLPTYEINPGYLK